MKHFLKQIVVAACCCVFVFVVACGKKQEDGTTVQNSTEEITSSTKTDASEESITTTEATIPTEEATEVVSPVDDSQTDDSQSDDTSEEVAVSDDGMVKFKGVSVVVPDGYVYSPENSSIDAACFMNEESESVFVICVDSNNTVYTEQDYETVFDPQIKAVYGDEITHEEVMYNNHECVEWNLDSAGDENCGRALAVIEGNMMVYIEFFGYGDHVADYLAAVNTLTF